MTLPLRILSTDFDGTLFAEFENPPVPHRVQKVIGDLQKRGVRWVINTGRDMSSLMEALGRSHLTIEPDFLVLVEREIFVHEDSRYVGLTDWNERCHRCHEEVFAQLRTDLADLAAWVNGRFHTTIYQDAFSPFCLIAGSNGDADIIHAHLDDYCRGVPNLVVVRNDVYMRFSHADFNKGTALAEISRRLGVSNEQVFAAGDHLNDLPMLQPQHARWLGAPANAVPAVKVAVHRHGGHVSALSHGEGVAEAVELLLERFTA